VQGMMVSTAMKKKKANNRYSNFSKEGEAAVQIKQADPSRRCKEWDASPVSPRGSSMLGLDAAVTRRKKQ